MKSDDEIPQDECRRLLASAHVDRVALSAKALPRVVPVQYDLRDDMMFACLGSYHVPERSGNGVSVAVSADDRDPTLRGGWSVRAVGSATFEYDVTTGLPSECGQPTAGHSRASDQRT